MSAMDESVGDAADANQDGTVTRSEAAAYDEAQTGKTPTKRKRGPSSTIATASPKTPATRRKSGVIHKRWTDFLRDHEDADATSK